MKQEFKSWLSEPIERLAQLFAVNPERGLSESQVVHNRALYGANSITQVKPKTIFGLLKEGVTEPMMVLLLSVAALSLLFGQLIEASAMVFVVIAYITVEMINNYRADRVMVRLKTLAAPVTPVLRDGSEQEIETAAVVVGDVLLLSTGSVVPADARLLSAYGLLINEASFTGESLPVAKDAHAQGQGQEKARAVFAGTIVVQGQATALVCAVGLESQWGKISQAAQAEHKEQTILQESMTKLAKVLALFAIGASFLIPAAGLLRGFGLQQMMLTWLSLTFLMIPGQPPIIIAMALALAAFQLAKKKVLVKRLAGVEMLGQVTAIISDKTGTITENKMSVATFYLPDGQETSEPVEDMAALIALALPAYCTDPTDKAVFDRVRAVRSGYERIDFQEFAEKKPWRTIVYRRLQKSGGDVLVQHPIVYAIAGSPEIIGAHALLSASQKTKLREYAAGQAGLGRRVVAYALFQTDSYEHKTVEVLPALNFVALAVLHDPVRPGAKEAIQRLEAAGVTTCMVTGDAVATAHTIAREVGLSDTVLTGQESEKMSDAELTKALGRSVTFARMDPLQKVRLVSVLKKKGAIVATIGDGVNDAPALKAAQVGIAMGQIGTDLAKEVADLILTDDNYVHIPDAIESARTALENFKKGLTYYLSAKTILLAVFVIPLLIGIPFPFAPMHIIMIELLMDLASSTIFVTEPPEPDCMKKAAPRMQQFLHPSLFFTLLKQSIALTIGILTVYGIAYYWYTPVVAQTAAFVTWLLGHIMLALNLKQERLPLIKQKISHQYIGVGWLLGMLFLSIVITSVPLIYPYTHTAPLPPILWLLVLCAVIVSTLWIEVIKLVRWHANSLK